MSRDFDFVIVGAGIFGAYAALFLASRGLKVALIDRETEMWSKASVVNQARLHFGYHYPRSISTAMLADSHRERFLNDHRAFVNYSFTKYYGIDRFNSLTDGQQFSRFCERLSIPARIVTRPDIFVSDRMESLFETTEYSFDPYLLRRHYAERLAASTVTVLLGETIEKAVADAGEWQILSRNSAGERRALRAGGVLNATYANLNAVNRMFGQPELRVVHEISEIALINAPALADVGLTIMDGPYMSVMPYGKSGLHSLSSVLYTHHQISRCADPTFSCQAINTDCRPDAVSICTRCRARPSSNAPKMIAQMRLYVEKELPVYYYGSLFTVKTKLESSFVDDARPTEIGASQRDPTFFSVFSGKVNSIYEVESILDDA